ncbi:MAG: hypothetical protein FJ356_05200 [Thaumarchaeota archaeon]|nr:hypothetical protein [Nitrososphaerota archaeon]
MEKFCYSKIKEIFDHITPEKILILGFKTDNKLKKNFFKAYSEERGLRNSKNRKLAYSYSWEKIPVFCMLHPTGNRISNEDWEKIKNEFYRFLRT